MAKCTERKSKLRYTERETEYYTDDECHIGTVSLFVKAHEKLFNIIVLRLLEVPVSVGGLFKCVYISLTFHKIYKVSSIRRVRAHTDRKISFYLVKANCLSLSLLLFYL